MFYFFKSLPSLLGLRCEGQAWHDSLTLVETLVDGHLEVQILEDPKPCGHVRYYVELIDTRYSRRLYIGFFEQDHIAPSVDLLARADGFIRGYQISG